MPVRQAKRAATRQAGAPGGWDSSYDVIVVGSGASGSVAAIFAHEAGAQTVVIEKGPVPGGTTAKSGGQFWVPNNRLMRAAGRADARDAFLRYVARVSFPGAYNVDAENLGVPKDVYQLMSTFYDNCAPTIEQLEKMGDLRCELFSFSPGDARGTYNYYSYLPEDAVKWGRTLAPSGVEGNGGKVLIDQLGAGLRKRSIEVLVHHQASRLITDASGQVAGVAVDTPDGPKRMQARRGVVFASGGYGQNREKLLAYQPGPVFGSCAVPSATGDAIDILSKFGARFDNLTGAWRAQVVLDHALENPCVSQDVFWIPADSGFLVNAQGRRCVNEKANYHSRTRTMYRWDENGTGYPDVLHFYVYDQRAADLYADSYPHPALGDKRAGWELKGKTLSELAAQIQQRLAQVERRTGGVRLAPDFVEQITATKDRFNRMALAGKDEEFGRGNTEADIAIQKDFVDALVENVLNRKVVRGAGVKNITMYPLSDQGPYYAIILAPGLLDTNGGPAIDEGARILDYLNRPIPGVFGAGNCIASPARNAYWGAGVTLGLGMTFGAIAGRNAAAQRPNRG